MSEQNNAPQEIDLIELFTRMGKWIANVTHLVFYGILFFFLRNIYLFILTIIAGVFLAAIVHITGQKFYKCELIGYSHTISNIEVIQFVNNWNYQTSFDSLSNQKVKDIKATYLLDINKDGRWDMIEESNEDIVTDTAIINKRLYGNFCIQLQVYDTTILKELSNRLFDYMAQNKRVKEMNEIRLRQQKEILPKIQKELVDLDSLKYEQYFEQSKQENDKNGSLLIWNEKEVKLYHDEILKLYQQKQNIERNLFLFPDPFEIIQDFTVPRQAENSFRSLILLWEKVSIALGFLFILLFDQRRRIQSLLLKSKTIKD